RNAVSKEDYLWPGAIVPYVFTKGYSKKSKKNVKAAMEDMMNNTCIQFRKKKTGDKNWLQIGNKSNGCYAMIGRGNSRTTVNLPEVCTTAMGRIQHELLHALGFWHEHSRSDRDDYVNVVWENVRTGNAGNFDKRTSNINNQNVGYDYKSVMHYGKQSFTKVYGQPTLVTTSPEGVYIGQRTVMSQSDYAEINILYNCDSK
ncbi:hypothetical protein CAPTEDRAFT_115507, partial [Capitella teleta]